MGEAIFAKYSKGGKFTIPPELIISNATKAALGLSNSATLDDCLRIQALSDPNYSTILVTLKDVDGSPLGEHKIKMTDSDGKNLVYTTDGAGQCIFKTTAGQAVFSEDYTVNNQWFDVGPGDNKTIDCPIGSVRMAELQRRKTLTNGWSGTITSNRWCNFSKYADKLDVSVRGGSGQGGTAGYYWYSEIGIKHIFTWDSKSIPGTRRHMRCLMSNGTTEGNFWSVQINNPYEYKFRIENKYVDMKHSGIIDSTGIGGNGALGSVNEKSNIDISNKSFYISGISSYSHDMDTFVKFPIYVCNYSGDKNSWVIVIDTQMNSNNGATGSSVTGFGITASGGRGGDGSGVNDIRNGTSYGEGPLSGYPGTKMNAHQEHKPILMFSSDMNWIFNFSVHLQSGNSCPGQVTISNFRYK